MSNSSFSLELSWQRKWLSRVMKVVVTVASILAIVPLLFVFAFVFRSGFSSLSWNFFTQLPSPIGQTGGGMANALIGSFVLVLIAGIIGIPVGVFCGVFLSEYGKGKLAKLFRFVVDLLTSIPSIVVGLFVYSLLVVPFKGFSTYAGSVALAILMFPSIIKTTEEVLKLIPQHVREAGLALGIPRWRVVISIVLKGSTASVMTGIILSIARVSGETAPLLFTAFGNQYWMQSLSQPTPSLPVQIYNYAISPYEDWHRQAWAGAFVLLLSVFVFNLSARLVIWKARR